MKIKRLIEYVGELEDVNIHDINIEKFFELLETFYNDDRFPVK